jgi:hypothetical protein
MSWYIPLRASGKRGKKELADCHVVAFAIVDEEDYEAVQPHRWHLTDTGYAARWTGGRKARYRIRMHRQILGLERGDRRQADHINRDKLDNRRHNLRIVAGDAENRQNVPARGGSSQHRGVTWDKERGKWQAQARCGGKVWRKRFATEQEAADAAAAWRAEHMPFSTA